MLDIMLLNQAQIDIPTVPKMSGTCKRTLTASKKLKKQDLSEKFSVESFCIFFNVFTNKFDVESLCIETCSLQNIDSTVKEIAIA